MNDEHQVSRRTLLAGGAGALAAATIAGQAAAAPASGTLAGVGSLDPVKLELVMNLVVTCSSPEAMGPVEDSKDGKRGDVWPIIGGRFEGPNIRGTVVPGGGDFPVLRPDGAVIIDALYRLKTDDGITIIIHNRGLGYRGGDGKSEMYRLAPEFIAPVGKYDWLNKSIFVSTLVDVPAPFRLAKGKTENDRLIQVYRVA